MESNKWETEEKEINMTQAEQDRISERWLRITRAIKNAAEQVEDRKVAKVLCHQVKQLLWPKSAVLTR